LAYISSLFLQTQKEKKRRDATVAFRPEMGEVAGVVMVVVLREFQMN
jgi:hypothetical protein